MTTREQSLACLYVLRWARYRRSPHVQSLGEREASARLLAAKKRMWRQDGRVPLPDEREEPDPAHILSIALGTLQVHDPTNQEAWLTVELVGRIQGFAHKAQLAGWSLMPYSWFQSGSDNSAASREACRDFLAHLASVLGCEIQTRSEVP